MVEGTEKKHIINRFCYKNYSFSYGFMMITFCLGFFI
jgi:hypothetical protein